jgi:hypothetical protein
VQIQETRPGPRSSVKASQWDGTETKEILMQSRITVALIVTSLVLPGPVNCYPSQNGIEIKGDLRISNGAIVFPDGSTQATAIVSGPRGVPGPEGIPGVEGRQGPTGAQGQKGITYVSTVLVSPVGTAQENGNALLTVLAGITDADSTKPYMLKIEPGIYDVQTTPIQMKQFVDIEGSGENVTILTGSISDGYAPASGVVKGADNAEIRLLKIRNKSAGSNIAAFYNNNSSPEITNVTLEAADGYLSYGLYNVTSSPTLSKVSISVTGKDNSFGIYNLRVSSPKMHDVFISASGASSSNTGVGNDNSSPEMANFTITVSGTSYSDNTAISNWVSSPRITNLFATVSGGSAASGMVNRNSSTTTIGAAFNVSGASGNCIGIQEDFSSSSMSNLQISVSDSAYAYGIYNRFSSPTLTNSVIYADSAAGNTSGILNLDSSPSFTSVKVTGKNGLTNYGMRNVTSRGPNIITIDNSTFEGSTSSILSDPANIVNVAATKLAGGAPDVLGTYKCINVYNDHYVSLGNTCQQIQ